MKRPTLQTRLTAAGHREYICDACLGEYAQFEHPLVLASNGITGEGKRATVHIKCYTEEIARELVQP
jgi:hypothetical protein